MLHPLQTDLHVNLLVAVGHAKQIRKNLDFKTTKVRH